VISLAPLLEAPFQVVVRQASQAGDLSSTLSSSTLSIRTKSAIRRGGSDPNLAAAIDIYDANRIGDWVNTHPSVALWLTEKVRGKAVSGFLTHEGWGLAPEINAVPWIDDEKPRFEPVNFAIPQSERKDPRRNVWTFAQAAIAALTALVTDKTALRIAGPSGFGKSRFAYELFNRRTTPPDEIENAAVIYADLSIAGDDVAKLALEIADAGSPTILVVDECPDEMHRKLVNLAQRAGSKLRLVTIDVETKIVQARETLVIRLEPAADGQITSIAKAVAPALSESDMRFIEQLAQGFPQMAVLAAQQNADGRDTIHSAAQVVDRIVWGSKTPNSEAQKALELASLFEWIGLTERVGNEVALIASELAGTSTDMFVEHLLSFKSRGILTQRGDYVQVGPIPLAAWLSAQRLTLLQDGKLFSFFMRAPQSLKSSLLRRLRWLDTNPQAKAFVHKLLSAENLGNFDALNTDFGAECLDRLVHVDPGFAMATIDRVFGGLTTEQLKSVGEGRRHLVWALEKLVFRRQSFDRAATLLRRLAAAETEDGISNNASGQFKQLYQLYLSGTEAPPSARLLVLHEGLQSLDPKEQELSVAALDHMLTTHHFSRGGGAEEIGTGNRLEDWSPKTVGEMRDFYREAVARLSKIALSNDPLSQRAKQSLASHLRGLINQLPFDEIKALISRMTERFGFWPEALQEINEWLYFDRSGSPPQFGDEVRAYFDQLMPTDAVELIVLYTQGWQADFHDPDRNFDREQKDGHDFEYSLRKAGELADKIATDPVAIDRALSRLVGSAAKTVYPFARRLAELADDPVGLFKRALAKAEASPAPPNRQFFGALIAGSDNRNSELARECIRVALKSPKLRGEAIAMIGAGRLQPRDITMVASLLQSGDVKPWQCASLSYGRGMDHLPPEDVMPLLDELVRHGAEGLWTVLDMVMMLLHGRKKPAKVLLKTIKSVLVAPELFDRLLNSTMDGFRLKELVQLLDKHDAIDQKFARALSAQLFSICNQNRRDVFYPLDDPVRDALRTLIKRHPKAVWDEAAKLLVTDDALLRFRVMTLIETDRDDHLGAGLLFDLPPELYWDWVRKEPSERASIILKWLPVADRTDDGRLAWHPALSEFISEFGQFDNVLRELAMRLHPKSWWGSLDAHLEPIQSLFDAWREHPRPEVRAWAHRMADAYTQKIEEERKRGEEDLVRY